MRLKRINGVLIFWCVAALRRKTFVIFLIYRERPKGGRRRKSKLGLDILDLLYSLWFFDVALLLSQSSTFVLGRINWHGASLYSCCYSCADGTCTNNLQQEMYSVKNFFFSALQTFLSNFVEKVFPVYLVWTQSNNDDPHQATQPFSFFLNQNIYKAIKYSSAVHSCVRVYL